MYLGNSHPRKYCILQAPGAPLTDMYLLSPAKINSHTPIKMWDEITLYILNHQRCNR